MHRTERNTPGSQKLEWGGEQGRFESPMLGRLLFPGSIFLGFFHIYSGEVLEEMRNHLSTLLQTYFFSVSLSIFMWDTPLMLELSEDISSRLIA